jgi:hypothetical protein
MNVNEVKIRSWSGNLTRKKPVGRTSLRWKDKKRMNLKETMCEDDWIHVALDMVQ